MSARRWLEKLKDEKGYLTIEVTLVFSVVFFVLLLLLFMGMVLYQHVNLQSLAVRASERGAVIYSSRVEDMNTGVKTLADFSNRDPYRYIPMFDNKKQSEYEKLINNYVGKNIGEYSILTGETNKEYVTLKDNFITRRVYVNIQAEYHLPVDAVVRMFGGESLFDIDTTAVSTVTDNSEFIRNVDLCVDLLKTNEAAQNLLEKAGKVQDLLREYAAKLQ